MTSGVLTRFAARLVNTMVLPSRLIRAPFGGDDDRSLPAAALFTRVTCRVCGSLSRARRKRGRYEPCGT